MVDFTYESDNLTPCRINISKPMDNLTKYEVAGQVFYTYKDPKRFFEVAQMLESGKTIGAIKLHRQFTGMGLKESRNYILPLKKNIHRYILAGLVARLMLEEPQYMI